MRALNFLRQGLETSQKYIKIVPIIYTINFFLALVIALPLYQTLGQKTEHLGIREDVLSGFSYEWWSLLDVHAEGFLATVRPALSSGFGILFDNLQNMLTGQFDRFGMWIFFLAAAYFALSAFLNGGIIGLFSDEKRTFTVSRFFSLSGYYFHHFIAIATSAALLFFLFYYFFVQTLFSLLDQITANWISERAVWFFNLGGFVLVLFFVFLINMIIDYAKIILVMEKKESAWTSIALAAKFVVLHFERTFSLYLLLAAIAMALTLFFGMLTTVIHPGGFLLILVLLTVQQFFVMVKIWIRINFYGAQLHLYKSEQTTVRKLRKV